MKDIIYIENLKCGGCAASIRKAVLAIPDISEVVVDLENSTVSLALENEAQRAEVVAVLDRLGYPEAGHNTILKQGKSFVSCAIGRMSN